MWYLPVLKDAQSMTESGGTIYLYSFDYEKVPGKGMRHADDLNYLMGNFFGATGGIGPWNENDYKISSIYVELLNNFIKFGNPTPTTNQWKPFDIENSNFYSISLSPHTFPGYHSSADRYWNSRLRALLFGANAEAQALSERK